jgi:hypothetical protein
MDGWIKWMDGLVDSQADEWAVLIFDMDWSTKQGVKEGREGKSEGRGEESSEGRSGGRSD